MGRGQPGGNHGKQGGTRSTLKPRPPKRVFNLIEMPDDIRERVASGNVIYLDIETTGLSKQYHDITTVVVLDKDGSLHDFVAGETMQDLVPFLLARQECLVVTYNGIKFDLPFIEAKTNVRMHHEMCDVYLLVKGMREMSIGLKALRAGLGWPSLGEGSSGVDAIWMWNTYCRDKDRKYLDAMLTYNRDDVLSLRFVLHALLGLPLPAVPERAPDPLLVEIGERRRKAMAHLDGNIPYKRFTEPGRLQRAALIPDTDLFDVVDAGGVIAFSIRGSQGASYEVRVGRLDGDAQPVSVRCSCPDFQKNKDKETPLFCKHVIKVLQVAPRDVVDAMFGNDVPVALVFDDETP